MIPRLVGRRRGEAAKGTDSVCVPGTYLGKPGKRFYFYPPSFIVGQVQVKQIEFVLGHFIYEILDFLFCKKMSGYVKHQPAPSKPWVVGDGDTRQLPFDMWFRGFALNFLGK